MKILIMKQGKSNQEIELTLKVDDMISSWHWIVIMIASMVIQGFKLL